MSLSRPSYRPVSGGKFSIHNAVKRAKKVGKKARHTVGRAQQLAEQNSHLIDQFDQQFDTNISKGVRQANNSIARAEEIASQVDGGKFHLNRVLRKAGHSVQKARSIARKAAPMLALAAPEIGLPLEAALLATGGRVRAKAAKKGGSFLAQGGAIGGGQNCPTCGSNTENRSRSSLVHPTHPSFNPKKPKTYTELIHTN